MTGRNNGTVARVWLLGIIIQIIIVGLAADCAPGGGNGNPVPTPTPTVGPGTPTTTPAAGPQVIVQQGDATAAVTVEFASTSEERQKGLMFREQLDEDAGMLFLFPNNTGGGFWMRNTYIPLDIAYISADGIVVDIRQGQPLDETILYPSQSYRYVLEVNQGWFARHNLGIGAKVTLPPNLPQAQ
jgi:uncharacterized membrane protein (UPF0127 family)